MLPRLPRNPHRRRPGPDQIAHRLVRRIRHPDRRQLSGAMQFRRHHRAATVGLHPVTRLHRDQGRCHHDAVVSHLDGLAMETIAAGRRIITEVQPLHQFADMIGLVRHRRLVADLAAALALRNCNRDRRLADIQPDERAIPHVVSPPFLRLGTCQSDATLERRMPRERQQTQSVQSRIMGSRRTPHQTDSASGSRSLPR